MFCKVTSHVSIALTFTLIAGLAAPASAGLVAHFPFDDGFDSTNGSFTGTAVNQAAIDNTTARYGGGSLSLNPLEGGIDGVGVDPGDQLAPGTGDYTVMLWYRRGGSNDTATDRQHLVSQRFAVNFYAEQGSLKSFLKDDDSSHNVNFTNGFLSGDEEWAHVAMVVDRSAETAKLISFNEGHEPEDETDQFKVATASIAGFGSISPFFPNFRVGYQQPNAGDDLIRGAYGHIDDLAIFDEALSEAEIESFRVNGVPEPASALLIGLAAIGLVGRRRRA